jgi:hypothetical protein
MATFFFFLIWYAFFIVAFGLAFYIMLHKDVKGKDAAGNDTSADASADGKQVPIQ